MTPEIALCEALEQLKRRPIDEPTVRELRLRVRRLLDQGCVAADLAAAAIAELGDGTAWIPKPLRVGETYLLLADEAHNGRVARIRYRERADQDNSLAPSARRAVTDAFCGLDATLLDAALSLREQPECDRFQVLVLDCRPASFNVEQGSLGLSCCVALLSAVTGRAPVSNVAATAVVSATGKLERVEHLGCKIEALRRQWPNVHTLVVAANQELPLDLPAGISIKTCETLHHALVEFGLDIRHLVKCNGLCGCAVEDLQRIINDFQRNNARANGAADWKRLEWTAERAWHAFEREDRPNWARRARTCAALYALHAGDANRAKAHLTPPEDFLASDDPSIRALALVAMATTMIDIVPAEALKYATQALEYARSHRREIGTPLMGMAIGTCGRAYMHVGDYSTADALLREAVCHYKGDPDLKGEVPRSNNYLATCTRMSGRLEQAMQIAEEAISDAQRLQVSDRTCAASLPFLQLERGRILMALGRLDEAQEEFQKCVGANEVDDQYPRIGAICGLARTLRLMGDVTAADKLAGRSCKVARPEQHEAGNVIGKVAATAAGDALLGNTRLGRKELAGIWKLAFGGNASEDEIRATLAGWVY